MADEHLYKQELLIRNLSTKSVTLSPSRAYVVRDINDISLKVEFSNGSNALAYLVNVD